MLATAREIEDRAWWVGSGTLYVGFQSLPALEAQASLYETFGERDDLDVHAYISDEWDAPDTDGVVVHTESADEIGDFWFLDFAGGEEDVNKSALVAEERTEDEFYGFWTYEPALVDEITTYLRETY
jgi:DICT domain-containing protein